MPGTVLRELIYSGQRVVGIRADGPDHQKIELRAQLVVGADGRNSRTAKLAGVSTQVKPNNRFMYFAYFKNLTLATGLRNQVWYLDPEAAYALPNDNGLTLLAVAIPKSKLAEFKQDVQGNYTKFFDRLPNGPNLRAAEQVSEVIGMVDIPLICRRPIAHGLALVGDAAMAPDPLWGNGIGWAIQAAEWLADSTAEALGQRDPEAVDRTLEQYRRQHHQAFAGRFVRDADFAQGRPFNIFERLMYSAAAREPQMAKYTGSHATRLAHIRYFPPLKAIIRALLINLTHREQASGSIPGQQRRLLAR